jgi:NAD(P)-dependent dehydrogenase (short-subunit alcohol dehydrogenase family)
MYGKPEHSGYSASKSGVISFVQSLGLEGYNAYSISPGRVDTKLREKDYPGEDRRTRLTTLQVAEIVKECIDQKYTPGDNIIIRKRGFRKLKRVDQGQPWKVYLNVQPLGTPKTI